MNIKLTTLAFSLALISCKNEVKEIPVSDQVRANAEQYFNEQAQRSTSSGIRATETQNITSPTTSNVPLNPPHGQPGHRCDIPVGAPLNSSAPVTNVTNIQPVINESVTQQVVTQTVSNTTGTTAEGFSGKPNPPHGQPGHRCDIAVGATLP